MFNHISIDVHYRSAKAQWIWRPEAPEGNFSSYIELKSDTRYTRPVTRAQDWVIVDRTVDGISRSLKDSVCTEAQLISQISKTTQPGLNMSYFRGVCHGAELRIDERQKMCVEVIQVHTYSYVCFRNVMQFKSYIFNMHALAENIHWVYTLLPYCYIWNRQALIINFLRSRQLLGFWSGDFMGKSVFTFAAL